MTFNNYLHSFFTPIFIATAMACVISPAWSWKGTQSSIELVTRGKSQQGLLRGIFDYLCL